MTRVDYEAILQRAKQKNLSQDEISCVLAELQDPESEVPHDTLLLILGATGDSRYAELVAQSLDKRDDPLVVRLALELLCLDWRLTPRYLERVHQYLRWIPWDSDGYIRQTALSIAGEYLRTQKDAALLQEVLDAWEGPNTDDIIRQDAYAALARAMGEPRSAIPSAAIPMDFAKDVDPLLVHRVMQRLTTER